MSAERTLSYFDHARCTSCGAQFDPETVVPREDGFACPACGSQLALKSLFGLKAAFDEDEAPAMTLDDAVPGFGPPPPATSAGQRGPGEGALSPPAARSGTGGPTGSQTALDVLRDLKRRR